MPLLDRPLPRALSIILALTTATAAQAQGLSEACSASLADQRLQIIVPNEAGGGYDTYARALAPVVERIGGMRAEVVNMPAAGGSIARSTARNAGPDEMILLLENTLDMVSTTLADETGERLVSQFDILGLVDRAPEAWLTSPAFDLSVLRGQPVVSAQGTIADSLIPVGFVARALGLTPEFVVGYSGSGEQTAAVLRGEVDMTSLSLTSALRNASDGTLKVALVVSDAPHPDAPDVPFLAGPGGLAELMTADLPAAERDEAQRFATMAAAMSGAVRGIHVANTLAPELKACLIEAVDLALVDPEMAALLEAQGRGFTPVQHEAAVAILAEIVAAFDASSDVFDAMLAEASE